jgi:SAM-dependent methyltransferase
VGSKKKTKLPWPTKAVMTQIYEMYLWGGSHLDFYSGEGSHHKAIVTPYITAVTRFLQSHQCSLTVCDLGCGDFNIGQHLVKYASYYIAIDLVDSLIDRNKERFKSDHLEFRCLDIVKDELPQADCAILRQVLQHLSNAEIKAILNKLSKYTYLVLTEHIPVGDFIPNKDQIASQGIRLKQQSGVDVLERPFMLKTRSAETLNEFVIGDDKGKIVTTLYQLY